MESPNDEHDRCPRGNVPENPFIALQRFAEEQMSAMLKSVLGIPSITSAHSPFSPFAADTSLSDNYRHRVVDTYNQAAVEAGLAPPGPAPSSKPEPDHRATLEGYKVLDVHVDGDSREVPSCPYLRRQAGEYFDPQAATGPYSPAVLEKDPRLAGRGPNWRLALQDLLSSEDEQESQHQSRPDQPPSQGKGDQWGPFRPFRWPASASDKQDSADKDLEESNLGPWEVRGTVGHGMSPITGLLEMLRDHTSRIHDEEEEAEWREAWNIFKEEMDAERQERSDPAEPMPSLLREIEKALGGQPGAWPFSRGSTVDEEMEDSQRTRESVLQMLSELVLQKELRDMAPSSRERSDAEPATELDAYEQLLGREGPPLGTSVSQMTQPWSSPVTQNHNEMARPSVVATMTTTESVKLPDGSVRTKRVLKRRFADGHEEEDQSECMSHANGVRGSQVPPSPTKVRSSGERPVGVVEALSHEKQRKAINEKKTEKSGWFWS